MFDNRIAEAGCTKIPYTCAKVILVGTPWYDWIYPNIQIVKCNVITKWWLKQWLINYVQSIYKGVFFN